MGVAGKSRYNRKRDIVRENDYYRYYDINGESFMFDPEDLVLVKSHIWLIDSYGYATTKINGRTRRFIRMLLKPSKNKYVDHINGNPHDNRSCNLRIANCLDNQRNMKIPKHNSSGYKGVGYRQDRGKYRAYISLQNRTKHLGYFQYAEEAARAYDQAARYYFGNFACLNFPSENEQGCRRIDNC